MNGAVVLARRPGQVEIPAESKEDIIAHKFWKRGTTAMFDIIVVNLDVGFYLNMTSEKALAKAEKENKDLYFQDCLEHRRTFTPMVYSAYGIPGATVCYTHIHTHTHTHTLRYRHTYTHTHTHTHTPL